jgi:hypothetical protein
MKTNFHLPEPSKNNPYAQVDFIFNHVKNLKSADSTKKNYQSALTFYKRFLEYKKTKDWRLVQDPRFYINKYWDEFSLIEVENFIEDTNIHGQRGYLASHTIVGYVSAIRNVLEKSVEYKLTASNNIFPAISYQAVRETENNEAYSSEELEDIMYAIQKELEYTNLIISKKGYVKTNDGQDPRIKPDMKGYKGAPHPPGWGWKEIDNLSWYFENQMECKALAGTPENKVEHSMFFQSATNRFKELGGLPGIYRKWGVASLINADIIMPLAAKLVVETGLNPESLCSLTVDCFQENHALSGVPYIQFYKLRSGGEKVLHLSLYDKNVDIYYGI